MRDTITVREVLQLLWEADCYPRIGNADWAVAAGMEADALSKAQTAVAAPDDPPEFAHWLEVLQNPDTSVDDLEDIYGAMHDYFGGGAITGAL
jgi:hypothetical protein